MQIDHEAESGPRNSNPWLGQIGAVLVMAALILWFVQMRKAPGRLLERRDCERVYASALTRADSVTVDARHLLTNRSPSDTLTCGALLRSGALR